MNVSNEKQWVSVKEYALMKGVSERAVQKAIAKGKHQVKEVPHPSRKDQVAYMIWTGEPSDELTNWRTTGELANQQTGEPSDEPLANHEENWRTGEPSGEPEATTDNQSMDEMDSMDGMDGDSAALPGLGDVGDADLGLRSAAPQAMGCRPSGTDVSEQRSVSREQIAKRQDDDPTPCSNTKPATAVIEYVPYHKMDEAQLYALLMQEIDRRLREAESKCAEWKQITYDYNERRLVPDLRALKGVRSERALRLWWQKWHDSDQDMFELVHKNNAKLRGRKVTQFEQDYLLKLLLEDPKISIGSAITNLKDNQREYGLPSPSSEATLKRWCNDYAAQNPAVWAQCRYGDKYVKDNIVKSLMRDTSDIKFGDVLVADGHVIANDIINPVTGKAGRLTLIMFYDWASRYPVGASLAYTEDSVHILTALRNAILQLGFIPRCVYLDNGRAFKSKLFHEKWDEHDLKVELAGIMPRLGIEAHFAEAYNGRSKVIERFFKTMQDQWERFMSCFRGSSIADKPAHLMRNEKWAQKMFAGKPMGYDDALTMAYYWVRYMYGNRIHSALAGKTPYQVFSESEVPADREINIRDLDILMLKAERSKVRKDGIMLYGGRYWAPELVDYALQPVIIRYDYCDLRNILVYDQRSKLVCIAELREAVHGFAFLSDNPLAYHQVKQEINETRAIRRTIQRVAKREVMKAKAGVEREMVKHQGIIDARQDDIRENNPLFKNPPMMPEPVKRYDVQDDIAELERVALQSDQGRESSDEKAADASTKVINLEDLLSEDEGDLAENVSFSEIQKLIGIK